MSSPPAIALLFAAALATTLGSLTVPASANRGSSLGDGASPSVSAGMSGPGTQWRAPQASLSKMSGRHLGPIARVSSEHRPARLRIGLVPAYGSAVSVLGFTPRPDSEGRGHVAVGMPSGALSTGGPSDHFRVEASPTGGMRLYVNGHQAEVGGRTVFGNPAQPLQVAFARFGSRVEIDQKGGAYPRGRMSIGTYPTKSCSPGYCLRVVLRMSMKDYLLGLGEIPTSWSQPALRAQVMAARAYALRKVETSGQHRYPCDCALYDSVVDQAYIGKPRETGPRVQSSGWRKAVSTTMGQLAPEEGAPVEAVQTTTSDVHSGPQPGAVS